MSWPIVVVSTLPNWNPGFTMETADERRNHEGVGVIIITESMGMPCEGFMIPDKYKVW